MTLITNMNSDKIAGSDRDALFDTQKKTHAIGLFLMFVLDVKNNALDIDDTYISSDGYIKLKIKPESVATWRTLLPATKTLLKNMDENSDEMPTVLDCAAFALRRHLEQEKAPATVETIRTALADESEREKVVKTAVLQYFNLERQKMIQVKGAPSGA